MRANPWDVSQETLDHFYDISLTAARNGWQMHEHSSRDVKIRAMLDVFEDVNEIEPIMDMRWTIAHTNGISDESIARANALGMVYAVHSSRRLMTAQQLGMGASVPPVRSIHASGGVWDLGSDGTTVASPNPFHTIGWAVTGLSPSGLKVLEETVPREAVLAAHTRSNAYILSREDDLGSLEPGKLVDLAVLDRDYMGIPAEEIKDLRSVMTLVGGEVVYSEL
jgi:predicted amidohydrolase YtcJ